MAVGALLYDIFRAGSDHQSLFPVFLTAGIVAWVVEKVGEKTTENVKEGVGSMLTERSPNRLDLVERQMSLPVVKVRFSSSPFGGLFSFYRTTQNDRRSAHRRSAVGFLFECCYRVVRQRQRTRGAKLPANEKSPW
ncbi:hypothetical protein CR983_03215 [Candidatus Saccharibacteria bacterium]|nr:MAG: hypothetical protein CR983_03215 [Candidatus Saccharibacteria bacterium]